MKAKNAWFRINLATNHNFGFKGSKILVNIHNKNTERSLNLALFLITILSIKDLFFF